MTRIKAVAVRNSWPKVMSGYFRNIIMSIITNTTNDPIATMAIALLTIRPLIDLD